jgi:hypothetical protein
MFVSLALLRIDLESTRAFLLLTHLKVPLIILCKDGYLKTIN